LYFTVASVDEVTVTEVTVEVTLLASGLLAKELIALANVEPFCSRATRWLVGVDEAKNFAQFALIWATAVAEEPPVEPVDPALDEAEPSLALPDPPRDGSADGRVDGTADGSEGPEPELDEPEPAAADDKLLEQAAVMRMAAIAPAVTRPLPG
jgi:hypothetical protein